MTTKNSPVSNETAPSKITVIGAGAIGLSWTALFLANRWKVTINDPRAEAARAAHDALLEWVYEGARKTAEEE